MDISGLDKAAVLATLYNASHPQGMGFLAYNSEPMTVEQARELLNDGKRPYFDYLQGRVMKINLSGNELDTQNYNRDNGANAAEQALAELVATGSTNTIGVQIAHRAGTQDAADKAAVGMERASEFDPTTGTFILGMADVAHVLAPAIETAVKD